VFFSRSRAEEEKRCFAFWPGRMRFSQHCFFRDRPRPAFRSTSCETHALLSALKAQGRKKGMGATAALQAGRSASSGGGGGPTRRPARAHFLVPSPPATAAITPPLPPPLSFTGPRLHSAPHHRVRRRPHRCTAAAAASPPAAAARLSPDVAAFADFLFAAQDRVIKVRNGGWIDGRACGGACVRARFRFSHAKPKQTKKT
jgi:hypothetical protein